MMADSLNEGVPWWERDASYAVAMWPHKHRFPKGYRVIYRVERCCWEAAYRAIFASNGQEAPTPIWEFTETIERRRE